MTLFGCAPRNDYRGRGSSLILRIDRRAVDGCLLDRCYRHDRFAFRERVHASNPQNTTLTREPSGVHTQTAPIGTGSNVRRGSHALRARISPGGPGSQPYSARTLPSNDKTVAPKPARERIRISVTHQLRYVMTKRAVFLSANQGPGKPRSRKYASRFNKWPKRTLSRGCGMSGSFGKSEFERIRSRRCTPGPANIARILRWPESSCRYSPTRIACGVAPADSC